MKILSIHDLATIRKKAEHNLLLREESNEKVSEKCYGLSSGAQHLQIALADKVLAERIFFSQLKDWIDFWFFHFNNSFIGYDIRQSRPVWPCFQTLLILRFLSSSSSIPARCSAHS